jgi:glutathione S-transferase
MAEAFRILGAENSPYSVKTRSYFRYKGIPHEWILRSQAPDEFQKHAKLPLVPLVITPEAQGMQDSTPILEKLEARFPEPSIHPKDPVAGFVSVLLEEFGDEWGNKWMFHYRWAREVDQIAAATRLVGEMAGLADPPREMVDGIRARMVDRVWFVGSSAQTAAQIERSFADAVELLEAQLVSRPYLFGGRPVFADFGLWGQIYNASLDPTPGAILEERAPNVRAWVERMLDPRAEGELEPWESLAPGLTPLLEREVGALFLPWSDANARAIAAGNEEFSVELAGHTWTQKPQKYHARSLAQLREKYAAVGGDAALARVLEATGCLRWLRA